MGKAEKSNFYVAIVLYGKEMKWTSLHMNARGQGHLFTFAKVLEAFSKKITIRLNDSTFHMNPIWDEKSNGSEMVIVTWPR